MTETIVDGLGLLEKPHCIWNCDEMSKNFEHDPVRVVAAKGEACVSKTSTKSTNITVMACVNASGRRMPPMFIVKGKTSRSLHGFDTASTPVGSRWFYQQNGWMDDSIGEHWFDEVFLQYCGSERPQLLILDGHSSHETLSILMRAMEENVHILALPPHTTHFLQPLDRAVFAPLNRKYNEVCSSFLQENPLHQINKWTFCALFKSAWNSAVTISNICSGFKACGIYPVDRTAIPDSAFAPSEPSDKPLLTSSVSERCSAEYVATPINPVTESFCPATTNDPETSTLDSDLNEITVCNQQAQTSDGVPVSSYEAEDSQMPPTSPSLDLSVSNSQILDISNPEALFQLIASGEILMDPLTDSDGKQLFVNTPPDLSACQRSSSPMPDTIKADVDGAIEATFLTPKILTASNQPRQIRSKHITKHRLLTSEDVIGQKMEANKLKVEKENKKKKKNQLSIKRELK